MSSIDYMIYGFVDPQALDAVGSVSAAYELARNPPVDVTTSSHPCYQGFRWSCLTEIPSASPHV